MSMLNNTFFFAPTVLVDRFLYFKITFSNEINVSVILKTKSSHGEPTISTSTELVAASAINLITLLISQAPADL